MSFKLKRIRSIPVIEIEGRFLGSLEGENFKELLDKCKTAGDIRVVVDLSKTDFVDSSGIGAIIGGLTSMRNVKGDLRLSGMQKRIKALFLMTKLLGSVFELFDNADHAVASYERDAQPSV